MINIDLHRNYISMNINILWSKYFTKKKYLHTKSKIRKHWKYWQKLLNDKETYWSNFTSWKKSTSRNIAKRYKNLGSGSSPIDCSLHGPWSSFSFVEHSPNSDSIFSFGTNSSSTFGVHSLTVLVLNRCRATLTVLFCSSCWYRKKIFTVWILIDCQSIRT